MDDNRTDGIDRETVKYIIERFSKLQDQVAQQFISGLREEELKLVQLRDTLVDIPRIERTPAQHMQLEKINTALSLVISLEYPVGSLEKSKLKDAIELLNTL